METFLSFLSNQNFNFYISISFNALVVLLVVTFIIMRFSSFEFKTILKISAVFALITIIGLPILGFNRYTSFSKYRTQKESLAYTFTLGESLDKGILKFLNVTLDN